MYCISALGRKKKDGSTGDHSIDLNPGLPLLHFVAAFLIWFSMISCSPFSHICYGCQMQSSILELCFILTFSNFHVHFLFGHEKKKKKTLEVFTDTRLQLSGFTFKNKIITRLKWTWFDDQFENCSVTEVRAKQVGHFRLFCVIMKVLTNSDRFHTTLRFFIVLCSKQFFSFDSESVKEC